MAAKTYFKVLDHDGRPYWGGSGDWPLPVAGQSGAWRSVKGTLVPCENGLHLCEAGDILKWGGPALWIAEGAGQKVRAEDKIVFRRARLLSLVETWNAQTLRLFAADCAEHVLPLFEAVFPDDDRPRRAIQAARDFAYGRIGAAARDAAGAAAGAAARVAAGAAARVAARDVARDAARDAAWVAARAAAWDAARDAAWAAAWAAARAAARDAARAAARDAAWAAAWAAARDAARDVEHQWQTDRLMEHLGLATPAVTPA